MSRARMGETEAMVWRVAECARFLEGGAEQGRIFLDNFYPHESRHLADGDRLSQQGIDAAISFLFTVRDGLTPRCPSCGTELP